MQEINPSLFLGNVNDALFWAKNHEPEPSIIFYLGQIVPDELCRSKNLTLVHLPLVDGVNNSHKILNIVGTIYHLTTHHTDSVLIACRAGLSRSVAVTTAVYALTENVSFDEAFDHMKSVCKDCLPEQSLLRQVRKVMEELRCCL